MEEFIQIFIWTVMIECVASIVALLCCVVAFKLHKKVSWLASAISTVLTTLIFMFLTYGNQLFYPSHWEQNKSFSEIVMTTLILLLVFSLVPSVGVAFYCRKRFELKEKTNPSPVTMKPEKSNF